MFSFLIIFSVNIGIIYSNKDVTSVQNVCNTTLHLTEHGKNASVLLSFVTISVTNPCHIHLVAPNTHLLYVRVVENRTQFDAVPDVTCPVNLYQRNLQEKKPSYSVDPCSDSPPTDGGLLVNDIDLIWTPSPVLFPQMLLLITTLGAGEVCQQHNQHTCLQAGWTPLLCISQDLLCDGIVNCPTGDILADENPQFCKDRKNLSSTNWEKLASEFLKKITGKSRSGSLLPAIQKGDKTWLSTTPSSIGIISSNNTNVDNEPISSTLHQYGLWGFLMLGMLLCGAVLTCCGLWECCCKRTKTVRRPPVVATPSVSTTVASTAVLVVEDVQPPRYDELDQPPSYKTLFPDLKEVNNSAGSC